MFLALMLAKDQNNSKASHFVSCTVSYFKGYREILTLFLTGTG